MDELIKVYTLYYETDEGPTSETFEDLICDMFHEIGSDDNYDELLEEATKNDDHDEEVILEHNSYLIVRKYMTQKQLDDLGEWNGW